MSLAIKLVGAKQNNKRLESFSAECVQEVVNGVNRAAGVVLSGAKAACPVDTGNLRESIHIQPATSAEPITATVGTGVEYAPFVEFGTGRRGGYPYETSVALSYNKEWPGQAAQPFLGRSLHQNEKTIRTIVQESVNRAVKHV